MDLATVAGVPNPLADWRPLFALLAGYAVVVGVLFVLGGKRSGYGPTYVLPRVSRGLTRVTRMPGWVAASVGTATFGLLVAGMGFYNDVAWHVRLGRDEELFTAPHSAIVIGLFLIFGAAVVGTIIARIDGTDVGVRIGPVRVPWSMLVLGLLGGSALMGFPLDELWHRFYGIDVTMWSPTHLLMIVGASLSPLASWLALSEGKVRPSDGRWAAGLHIAVGAVSILGLASVQGEFEFGVPQFQQLYHPVLFALAAGFALTAMAIVVKRWWSPLVVAGVGFLLAAGDNGARAEQTGARAACLFIVSAVVVAVVAKLVGVERRLRFAAAAGIGVGTFGLAGEWWWNQGAHQSWKAALLPEAVIYALVAAVAAAVLGAAFASAVRGERGSIPPRVLGLAGIGVLAVLALPFPRTGGNVSADIHIEGAKAGVTVEARLAPADAAEDARWFQTIAWQGGGFVAEEMVQTGERGVYRSERPVPVDGKWKTMLRLHRGSEMTAIPVFLPADPEIGAQEVPAVDRSGRFETEQQYLLREQHGGPAWYASTIFALLGFIALLWVSTFVVTAREVSRVEARPLARV